ncbi:MAG TPA: lytic murein transglycosylase [Rhabdaerophilum sp.]|nr:lytic murein transglycosylase [Rhabdaerophilum sp.]
MRFSTLIRLGVLACFAAVSLTSVQPTLATTAKKEKPAKARSDGGFQQFLQHLWIDAQARGISRKTFDLAFAGVTPNPAIIKLTVKQSEFVKPIWSYLDGAISQARLQRGAAMAERYASHLAALERKYGVDRRAILGVWGMETNFGSYTGDMDVIRSLATLAFKRYRGDFFRDELLVALKIIEDGEAERSTLRGSWAGAMGQTQFMPSSFAKYAVDGDGDGVRDIWGNVPDALASTANYLASFGWQAGVPWGVEVTLPANFDLANAGGSHAFSRWASAGLTRTDGEAMPRKGEAFLYLPAGIRGPALLVTENYRVIKKYNSSDAYALAVAHLGDRLLGSDPLRKAWPRADKRLSMEEVKEIQRKLQAQGLPVGKIDGRIGEISRESVKKAQIRHGLPADGYPTLALLERLREKR